MFLFTKMMIKQHIRRSYMIILGIACSVTMMFCMIQMGDSINEIYQEQAMGTNRYDFHVMNLTEEQAELLQAEMDKERIEASGFFYSDYCESQMKLEELQKIEWNLCAGTKEGFEEPGLRLRDGRWSELSDEIVLEQYFCEMLGKQIGDEVAVVCGESGEHFCFRLVGIMENSPILTSSDWTRGFMCVSFLFPYDAGLVTPQTEEYNLVVTVNSDIDAYDIDQIIEVEEKARESLAQIYGLAGYQDTIQRVVYGQASEEEEEIVRRINGNIGSNTSKEENIEEYRIKSQTGNAVKAFVILIAVAMVLLIFNSMYLTIAENTKELGMLRCIGMDYKQTGLIIVAENAFYCVLGYGIGILFGNILNQVLARTILFYLTGDHIGIRQLGSSYVLTAVVVLLSLILAFVLSIHKILVLTPIEASKYNGLHMPNAKARTMEKWSAVSFAGRNIMRGRSKSMIVMISMIFSMTIVTVIINTVGSVKMPEKDRKSEFSDYEVYIPLTGMLDTMEGISSAEIAPSEMEEVRNTDGVGKLYAIGSNLDAETDMYRNHNEDYVVPNIIYNDELFQWLLEQNGMSELWEDEPDSICVITGTYREEQQELLDEIEAAGAFDYRMKNGKEGTLSVDAVLHTDYIPEYKGTAISPVVIILTEKTASEIYQDYSYLDVMVKWNPDAREETYAELVEIFADNEYAILGSYEVGMEKVITDTLAIISIAALIVSATAVTAVLNMMIIMKANLVIRRKEYGIWRALGMSLRRLKGTISVEVILMLAASYVIAVAFSLPIQYQLCTMMENHNIKNMGAGYLGVGIVSILLVYFLVMSGLRFRKTNEIMADIREE